MEFTVNANITCKIPIRLVMVNKNGEETYIKNPSACVKGVYVNDTYFSNRYNQLAAKDENEAVKKEIIKNARIKQVIKRTKSGSIRRARLLEKIEKEFS